jgi:hypothetical protein
MRIQIQHCRLFLFLWVILALLDPDTDPLTWLNPDPGSGTLTATPCLCEHGDCVVGRAKDVHALGDKIVMDDCLLRLWEHVVEGFSTHNLGKTQFRTCRQPHSCSSDFKKWLACSKDDRNCSIVFWPSSTYYFIVVFSRMFVCVKFVKINYSLLYLSRVLFPRMNC